MQTIYEVADSSQQLIYGVAAQTFVVEAKDAWAAQVIEELFSGWYLTPHAAIPETSSPAMVISSSLLPPDIPRSWPQFEIAGSGICFTRGTTSYIDIEGSIVAITGSGKAAVEVWMNGMLEIQSPVLTRVLTYALAAALRRRGLFELHSGAVIDPESERGVLIIGPSGSGKSTLTVQLAAAGWSFLTDDVLLLNAENAEAKAWPLRRCFAITTETFAASNFLQAQASLDHLRAQGGGKDTKKQFAPHRVFNSEFSENCLPRTLIFSELVDGDRSHMLPLSQGETLARLIRMNPWSCYDQATAADHQAVLASLVKQSKAYSLRAGKDLLDPETAAKLIAGFTRN